MLERSSAKDSEAYGQVFLGVLANGFHQIAGFGEHLVGISVERWIAQKLAGRTLAIFEAGCDRVQFGDSGIDLVGKGLIFRRQSERSLAGIYFSHELVGFGNGLVGVIVQGRIFDKLASRALAN